jgi:hypothetical protein
MQQALKFAPGAARTEIFAAEPFDQLDVAANEASSALDVGFRGE